MADRPPDALEAALAALRRSERTTAELATWLRRRGCDANQVADTIAELTRSGALDDERFARRYAEDKRELRGWGSGRIREALATRGIAPPLIERTLESDSEGDQLARASLLLARRGRPLVGESHRARALGFLTRRGYDYEIAHEAIRLAARRAA